MILQSFANLECTSHWFFRATEEKERHPIASRHSIEFAACLRSAKTFGVSDDLIEFLQQLNLFIDQ
jgi:hypothetical protein